MRITFSQKKNTETRPHKIHCLSSFVQISKFVVLKNELFEVGGGGVLVHLSGPRLAWVGQKKILFDVGGVRFSTPEWFPFFQRGEMCNNRS